MSISTKLLRVSLLLCIFLVSSSEAGITQQRHFDEEALATYLDDPDFQYDTNAQQGTNWLSRALFWLSAKFVELMSTPGGEVLGTGLFYLIIGLVAIGTILLLVRMRYGKILIGSGDESKGLAVSIEEERDANYRQLFEEARVSGEMTLAARYLFLMTLQEMSQRGLIKWTQWKTSHDYAMEINKERRPDYLALSRFFESSWFGGRQPSLEEIDNYHSISQKLVNA